MWNLKKKLGKCGINGKILVLFGILLFLILICFNFISAFSGLGNGSLNNPYQIFNWSNLNEVRNDLNADYILINDLDSLDIGYDGIGNNWFPLGNDTNIFEGNFNGNNHVISDLIINSSILDYNGFFGNANGNISNIGIVNINIFSGRDYTGGLVGNMNLGKISGSYVIGNIVANDTVGGLAGETNGTIENSYFMGNVTGRNIVGGLVGQMDYAVVFDCYSSGNITGIDYTGGLVGANDVGIVNDSYYDMNISNQSDDDGRGIPKTIVEMKDVLTFGSWNISSSPIDLNDGYPYLAWQDGNNSFIWLIYEEPIIIIEPVYQSSVVYKLLNGTGAGLGIFFLYLAKALPILLIGLVIVGIVIGIGYGIIQIVEKSREMVSW